MKETGGWEKTKKPWLMRLQKRILPVLFNTRSLKIQHLDAVIAVLLEKL
jgi:hypothetical protein